MGRRKELNKEQREILERNGKDPAEYELVMDLNRSMIVHSRATGEYEVVEKI